MHVSYACPSMHVKHIHVHACVRICKHNMHKIAWVWSMCVWHDCIEGHACMHACKHVDSLMQWCYARICFILKQAYCIIYAHSDMHSCVCSCLTCMHGHITQECALLACTNISAQICTYILSDIWFIHAWHDITCKLHNMQHLLN